VKARLIASVVLAASVVLGTSACNLVSPQTTTKIYDASDGVSARVGDLKIRNAMVITGDGKDGNLLVSITNVGSAHSLTIQYGDDDANTVETVIPEESTVSFGTEDEDPLLLEGIDAEPGSLMTLFFQYGEETGVEALVPVLDGTLPEYSEFVPGGESE
jgi:hypothetical protein